MKKLMTSAAIAALSATCALAGNFTPPPPAPAPSQPRLVDWTGFYVGAQAGFIDIDSNAVGVEGDGGIVGLTAGYDHDVGRGVVGVALDYDVMDVTLTPGVDAESVFRAKLRSGVKTGSTGSGLVYVTGGYAEVDTTGLGTQDGSFLGMGYEHLVSDGFSVGGEVLFHDFSNVNNTTLDVDARTFQIRGAFRF